MTLLKCQHCVGEDKAAEDTEHVEKILPPGYSHLLCHHELLEMSGDVENFRAALKLQMTTEEQVQKWLEDFQKSSALTWRKSRTYPDSGRYNKYRVDLRCQHKTYSSSSKTTKNTNCPATMFLILKRFMYERKSRSGDPHIEEGYFLHVNLRNEHNHRLNTAEVMRWRDVSNDTIEKLQQLYKSGHSPSSALKTIKYNLQEEEGDNYIYAIADRSVCPDLQFCYRLGYIKEKDISDELFKPLELEQSWETAAVTADGHSACIEDGVSVDAVPMITTEAEHFTEDNEPGPSATEEVVGSLDGQLEEIFGMLKRKLNEDASFTPPIRAFVSSFFQIKTDSALQASLFSFGKATPIINQINLLPATSPRRRGALAGRRAVGRPPKNSRREHPYCNSRSNNTPQTLTFCLQDNNTLEKTD
ncbi:Septation ring formation regulator EzrA [Labeo rohita]|uniref:Septation ring formation regulator EzrA n=1 Tax=Labeo rohita TaxID=84645 RepID=A0ABQ8MEG3_LABRO|nr:Septation ring formation regulator EzrA [Labeo rohita]